MTLDPCISQILKGYHHLFNLSDDQLPEVGKSLPIPSFSEKTLMKLCQVTSDQLQNIPILLEIKPPVYVVGDLHGNIFDLIRILNLARPPPHSSFLFLGDYVDRGQYSVEVVTLLFALFNSYPRQIFILRGNHEFEDINQVYGFQTEVLAQFGNMKLYRKINDTFGWLPLAAIIGQKIFCVHGGISPALKSMDQITGLKRPINVLDQAFVSDLVWSDPSADVALYANSTRGVGTTFGEQAVKDFLTNFGLTKILRAHQCIQLGISSFSKGSLITVFSCSNYADACGNKCGLVFVNANNTIQSFSLPPLEQTDRSLVNISAVSRTPIHVPQNEMVRSKSLTVYQKGFQPSTPNKRQGIQFFKAVSSTRLVLPKLHQSTEFLTEKKE